MSNYVLARIEALQQELESLKKVVSQELSGIRHETQIRGLWQGVKLTDEDFEEAEQAVFGKSQENSLE